MASIRRVFKYSILTWKRNDLRWIWQNVRSVREKVNRERLFTVSSNTRCREHQIRQVVSSSKQKKRRCIFRWSYPCNFSPQEIRHTLTVSNWVSHSWREKTQWHLHSKSSTSLHSVPSCYIFDVYFKEYVCSDCLTSVIDCVRYTKLG